MISKPLHQQIGKLSLVLSALLMLVSPVALADNQSEYAKGVTCFYRRDYRRALGYLTTAMQMEGVDADTLYYIALSYQYLKDFKAARGYFERCAREYPSTKAGALSLRYLGGVKPAVKSITAPLAKKGSKSLTNPTPVTAAPASTAPAAGPAEGATAATAPARVNRSSVVHNYDSTPANAAKPVKKKP